VGTVEGVAEVEATEASGLAVEATEASGLAVEPSQE